MNKRFPSVYRLYSVSFVMVSVVCLLFGAFSFVCFLLGWFHGFFWTTPFSFFDHPNGNHFFHPNDHSLFIVDQELFEHESELSLNW
jgi:hypothetical protein